MFSLIIGGAASGKSVYAERLVCRLPGERIYLATMEPFDQESLRRIEKHRKRRAGQGFRTVERYRDLSGMTVSPQDNILLECLGNLLAGEMFGRDGKGERAVLEGIRALREKGKNLTVVTNEVFSGGSEWEGETLAYMKALGRINCALAAEADLVCELVCGLPNILKGRESCLY